MRDEADLQDQSFATRASDHIAARSKRVEASPARVGLIAFRWTLVLSHPVNDRALARSIPPVRGPGSTDPVHSPGAAAA